MGAAVDDQITRNDRNGSSLHSRLVPLCNSRASYKYTNTWNLLNVSTTNGWWSRPLDRCGIWCTGECYGVSCTFDIHWRSSWYESLATDNVLGVLICSVSSAVYCYGGLAASSRFKQNNAEVRVSIIRIRGILIIRTGGRIWIERP